MQRIKKLSFILFFLYNRIECGYMVNFKEKDTLEVSIDKLDHFGNGLVKVENQYVFVKNALPSEKVKIEIAKVKKKFLNARMIEVITPSIDRVLVPCPYYEFCGGCQMMHQSYFKQLEFKKKKVVELFQKFAGIRNLEVEKIYSGRQFAYRNKVTFHGENQSIGLYQEKSNDLVEIESCLLVEDGLNQIYYRVKEYLKENSNIKITDLTIRKTSLNEYMMILNGNLNLKPFLEYLDELLVTSVYYNQKHVYGKEYITEEIFGFSFRIYPDAFFQVNYEMMKKLYQLVIDYYQDKNYQTVLDLYCGTGTIGILVSSYVKEVIGVEVVHDSILAASQNQEMNQLSNITFLEGKVEEHISKFQNIDSIILDPPRSGLDSMTRKTILKMAPQSIVYISCDPATLARDLKELLEDYMIEKVSLVDMFPNTYHVESVCIMSKKLA